MNFTKIENAFEDNGDFKSREFTAFNKHCILWFLDSLCDEMEVTKEVIAPLLKTEKNEKATFEAIKNKIALIKIKKIYSEEDAIAALSAGNPVLNIGNADFCVEAQMRKAPARSVVEPPTSTVVRGPREGFIENYKTNLGLITSKIKSEKLKIKEIDVGSLTRTKVGVIYLKGIASMEIVNEIVEKIKKIEIDGVIDSYYIQTYLSKKPKSIFKQCGITEKPDIAVAKLLEGRVAIIVDGSPFILTLPFILIEDLQTAEDYYDDSKKVTFVRTLRLVGIFIAIILPGIYLSFQIFHYKALPLRLLITSFNSSASIPLAPLGEILFAFLLFEILFEASIHIPKGLGSSFNIVGAIILGDTAIKSNLASAPTIMIVAVSSIALYLVPDQTSVLRILRIGFTFIAGMMGILGVTIGVMYLIAYLSDFDSYGAAYLGPYAPYIKNDLKDGIAKKNLRDMNTLPKSISNAKRWRSKK